MKTTDRWILAGILALILITAFGSWLRFSGLDWGLSWRYHVDENAFINDDGAELSFRFFDHPGIFIFQRSE